MASHTLYIDVLKKLQSRTHLDSDEAEQLLQAIFDQQLSEIQMAALLSALTAKGETVEEIVGQDVEVCGRSLSHGIVSLNGNAQNQGQEQRDNKDQRHEDFQ